MDKKRGRRLARCNILGVMESFVKAIKKTKDRYLVAAVAVVAFLVFANTLGHQFVWDDYVFIVNREEAGTKLTVGNLMAGVYPRDDTHVYRPVRGVLDALVYMAFGTKPLAYHTLVVLTHASVTAFVYLLIKELSGKKLVALLAGLLFAAHPIHVEAVAWVMAGLDLLFVLFYLPSVYWYVRGRKETQRKYLKWAWMLGVLAMFTNELALTLPMVIGAIDYLCFKRKIFESLKSKELRPYLIGFAAYWLLRIYFLARVGQATYVYESLPTNLLLVVTMFGQYIRYLVWPVSLSANHLFPNGLTALFVQDYNNDFPAPPLPVSEPWVMAGIGVSILVLGASWWLQKRRPLYSLGLVWIGVTLLPGLGIIPIVGIFAERRAYLASVGFVLMVAAMLSELIKKERLRLWVLGGVVAILLGYSFQAVKRNQVWHDSSTLWPVTYAQNPMSGVATNGMARVYQQAGDYEKALIYAKRALEQDPYGGAFQGTMIELYVKLKRWDELLAFYKYYLDDDPDNADLLFRIGTLYEGEYHDYEKAREYYHKVLEVLPGNAQAQEALKKIENK